MEDETPNRTIRISHADSKRALAVFAHLNQLVRTATIKKDDGQLLLVGPTQMSQAELLLSAASLRALLFDDTAILLGFLHAYDLKVFVDALETNVGMVLLPKLAKDEGHVTDWFSHILLDDKIKPHYPLNTLKQAVCIFEDQDVFEVLSGKEHLWRPEETNNEINHPVGFANKNLLTQMVDITRRRVVIEEWGDVRLGFLKDIPIRRRSLITYVANKLGGVHLDSVRLPPNPNDLSEFKALAGMYDPDFKAIVHGGLLAVGFACLELLSTPEILGLYSSLGDFLWGRQQTLQRAKTGSSVSTDV